MGLRPAQHGTVWVNLATLSVNPDLNCLLDRSNGFEKSFLMRENEKSNAESDRYKWSVEDM